MGILSQEQVALLTDYDAESPYSAAYRTLYANIRFNWNSEQVKQQAILLATPAPYTGQAVAAANISIAAAQTGTPTIVVDADLNTPSLQQRFGLSNNKGLSDLLMETTLNPQVTASYLQNTFIPDLHVLCAGTTSARSTSLLLATQLGDIIDCLRQFLANTERKPGLIIFHSAPVLAGTDASAIGALVDQSFLMLVAGRTTRSQAKQAQEQLQRAHAKLAGIILLDV